MTEAQQRIINHLLYEANDDKVIKALHGIKDTDIIYIYMFNYNWDNGFDIPNEIINHPYCDLSTALMMFYHADGDAFLEDKRVNEQLKKWFDFIKLLYSLILGCKYKKSDIKFSPPLSRVQIFKLKKILSPNENIFIEEFGNRNLNIIV